MIKEQKFKYHPKTKEELKSLVDDESIYLGDIDTSAITNMIGLFSTYYTYVSDEYDEFEYCVVCDSRKNFDGIEFWDVSNVTDMSCMFGGCEDFNQPLDSWDVSNVTCMSSILIYCSNFNQPLNSWDIDDSTNTKSMFYACGINEKIYQILHKNKKIKHLQQNMI